MNSMKRKISCFLLLVMLGAFALCSLSGCGKNAAASEVPILREPVAESVGRVTVKRGDCRDLMKVDAVVVPEETALSLSVSGTVGEMYFMSGDLVKKGDLLLKLDTWALEKEIDELTAELAYLQTEAEYEQQLYEVDMAILARRLQGNYETGGGWQQTRLLQLDVQELELSHSQNLRDAEKKLQEVNEKLESAKEKYEASFLYAPVSGTVYFVNGSYQRGVDGLVVKEGASVQKDVTLACISDETKKQIELEEELSADILEKPCFALISGAETEVKKIDFTSEKRMEIAAKDQLLRLRYEGVGGSLKDIPCGTYAPLMFVRKSFSDVLYVPANAVYLDTELQENYVYLYGPDGKYTRTVVECEACGNLVTVIKEGLSEGDELYVVR